MKINTSRTKVMKETVKAYADCNMDGDTGYKLRKLNYRAKYPLGVTEAIQVMCEALNCKSDTEAYNNFRPELLAELPLDAQVTLAREASVCIYFTTAKAVNVKRLQKNMLADEFDLQDDGSYRVWWD